MDVEKYVTAFIIDEAQVAVHLCRAQAGVLLLRAAHHDGLFMMLENIASRMIHFHANGKIGIALDGSLCSAVEDVAPHRLVHNQTNAYGKARAWTFRYPVEQIAVGIIVEHGL